MLRWRMCGGFYATRLGWQLFCPGIENVTPLNEPGVEAYGEAKAYDKIGSLQGGAEYGNSRWRSAREPSFLNASLKGSDSMGSESRYGLVACDAEPGWRPLDADGRSRTSKILGEALRSWAQCHLPQGCGKICRICPQHLVAQFVPESASQPAPSIHNRCARQFAHSIKKGLPVKIVFELNGKSLRPWRSNR